jgi:signal peptidase II
MRGGSRGAGTVRRQRFFLAVTGILVVVDQITKMLIARGISLYETVPVISGFFNLTHIHNRGAIFGFFSKSSGKLTGILLPVFSLAALSLVIYYFVKTPASDKWLKFSLSLILAGALGNQIDRFVRGYVIDFLDVYIKNWHWPTFNVADSCISCGAVILIFTFILRRD